MSETQDEIDEREMYEPDLDAEMMIVEADPQWVKKLKAKLSKIKLNLQLAYWTLRALHRHKWITTVDFAHGFYRPYKVIETERTCSICLKHQTNLEPFQKPYWATTELSYEEIQKRLNEPYKQNKREILNE